MRILIAEDDTMSRELLRINLETWGYDPVVCIDGTQAREALERPDAPRMAVLDWMMPGLSGVEVCRQLRAHETKRQTYVILLTARNQRQDIIEGLDAGADDYVVKPFDRQELRARVQVGVRVVQLQDQAMAAEQLQVLLQTVGAAAHEINQPLTVLLGKLELVMQRLNEKQALYQDLSSVFQAGQRIGQIVSRMSAARRYVTKPYVEGVDILDFDAAAQDKDATK